MEEQPKAAPNYRDAADELAVLPENSQKLILRTHHGCDYAGVDDHGVRTTCSNPADTVVFATVQRPERDETNALTGNLTQPKVILPSEEIKAYCPLHDHMAVDDLHTKLRKGSNEKYRETYIDEDGTPTHTHTADALPISVLSEDNPKTHAWNRQNANLVKKLREGLLLNTLRHSGRIKNVPSRGFARGAFDDSEDLFEDVTREEFGTTGFEEATGSTIQDIVEGSVHQALNPNFVQDTKPTAIESARFEDEESQTTKQAQAHRNKIAAALSRAKNKGHRWCTKCQKSTKTDPYCDTCFSETVDSGSVPKKSAGRPMRVDEENHVVVTTNSTTKAVQAAIGNAVPVPGPNGTSVTLPSTVDNTRDFLKGTGYAPDYRAIEGAHEKSDFTVSHFAPTEDYEDPETMVPSLGKGGSQYVSRTGALSESESRAAVFQGPSKADTGPLLGTNARPGVTQNSETGEYEPITATSEGKLIDFTDGSIENVDPNKSVKSRERTYGLNVKFVNHVAPSTTCHECSITGEASPVVRKFVKDHNGELKGVCAKGHRMPTSNIPVAWHEGRAVHVYPRPTGTEDNQGRPEYKWIPTEEPAVHKREDGVRVLVSRDEVVKAAPFRHSQEAFSRRNPSTRARMVSAALWRVQNRNVLAPTGADSLVEQQKLLLLREHNANFLQGQQEASQTPPTEGNTNG